MTDNTQKLDEILRDYDDDNACACYSDCAHPKDTKQAKQAIQAYTNAEIAKAKLEAFDVAFDCHDYDRLRAYRAKLKEVK